MPYNATPYTGAQYLFSGIANAGAAIGGGINQLLDRMQEKKDTEKKQARLFKSLQEIADVTGMVPKDKSTTMDLDTLQGVVQGHMMKQGMEDAAQDRAMRREQLDSMVQQRQSQQQEDSAIGTALNRYSTGAPVLNLGSGMGSAPQDQPPLTPTLSPLRGEGGGMPPAEEFPTLEQLQGGGGGNGGAMPTMPPAPEILQRYAGAMSPDARTRYALQTPGLGGRGAVNLLSVLEKYGAATGKGGPDWEAVKPHEGRTGSGLDYLYGKSGQFQILPNTSGGVDDQGNIAGGAVRTLPDGSLQTFSGKQWMNVPRSDKARNQKLQAETLVEVNKQLSEIGDNIAAWHANQVRADKDKKASRQGPEVLKNLEKRYRQLEAVLSEDEGQGQPADSAQTKVGGQPKMPKSRAEFDALPAGSLFVNPTDNKVYRKK